MILHLKPTGDELENLRTISKKNLDNIWIYEPQDTLEYEIPCSIEHFFIAQQIKDVLAQGGRVLLLTPDSESQELTLTSEA